MQDFLDSIENSICSNVNNSISEEEQSFVSRLQNHVQIIDELCELSKEISSHDQNSSETIPEKPTEETPKQTQPTVTGVTLKDPPDINEIITTDEAVIAPTSHNVGIINVACQEILKQIEQQLLDLLKKNRKEQEIVQNYLSTNGKVSSSDSLKKTNLKCAGMPYFKDFDGYPPPTNKDIMRKKRKNKLLPYDFIDSPSFWSVSDAKNLIKALKTYTSDPTNQHAIDWMKISVTDMGGKFSPSECKSKWMMNLRPEINKSKWGLKEIKLLESIAQAHNYQDWDQIAKDLGTNRTGFQCSVRYQTHRAPNEGKWTVEEDETLLKTIEKYRIKDYIPWKKVTWYFEKRSLRQCQERYIYHLADIKKGNFTMEEDFVLTYLATKLKNFGEVAKYLPKRVATQVRARFEYLVKLSMPEFSKEEDELLTKLMFEHPRKWEKISQAFKNRSKLQCRGRWAELQKDIKLDDIGSDSELEESDKTLDDKTTGKSKTNKDIMDTANISRVLPILSKSQEEVPKPKVKKFSEEYAKLLDYHKHCYKFLFGPKAKFPSSSEECEEINKKLRVTMMYLSVSSAAPLSSFNTICLSTNCEFDVEDVDVLGRIKNSETEERRVIEKSNKIIPPNYVTLVGLRSLILSWSNIRNMCDLYKPLEPHPEMNTVNPEDRILCSDAKKLFKSRMKTLFAFPLILSNLSQEGFEAKPVYKPKPKKKKPLSRRKRKEHAKLMSEAYRKKLQSELNKKLLEKERPDLIEGCDEVEIIKTKRKYQRRKPKNEVVPSAVRNGEETGGSTMESPNSEENKTGEGVKESSSAVRRRCSQLKKTEESTKGSSSVAGRKRCLRSENTDTETKRPRRKEQSTDS